jgi:hypothetical protein
VDPWVVSFPATFAGELPVPIAPALAISWSFFRTRPDGAVRGLRAFGHVLSRLTWTGCENHNETCNGGVRKRCSQETRGTE